MKARLFSFFAIASIFVVSFFATSCSKSDDEVSPSVTKFKIIDFKPVNGTADASIYSFVFIIFDKNVTISDIKKCGVIFKDQNGRDFPFVYTQHVPNIIGLEYSQYPLLPNTKYTVTVNLPDGPVSTTFTTEKK